MNDAFFYTSHGKYDDSNINPSDTQWKQFNDRGDYLFDADNIHTPYSISYDLSPTQLNDALRKITCQRLFIILQPCFSGDWINPLKGKNNRLIITSEIWTDAYHKDRVSIFDKCNKEISSGTLSVYEVNQDYTGWDDKDLIGDDEEYSSEADNDWRYNAQKHNEDLYRIDRDTGVFDTDFYENWKDDGVEFVSGLTEAFYIDRFTGSNPNSNNKLDADEKITNGNYIKTGKTINQNNGNSNDYLSCKEIYNYMRI